ncbi:MAG: helix-turn-helix domain-containing protein [Eubacterium sp.]|nr:helix-turn-helix domain-containing protein [Eubacterium sp.]
MAIGERIRFFRNLRGMTQKYLGIAAGFPERTADIRMAQYESGTRTPKSDLTKTLSYILDVSPQALNVPDIDSGIGIIHTLFALEDIYGIRAERIDGEIHLCFAKKNPTTDRSIYKLLSAWADEAGKYRNGEISKEEYDKWRYKFPEFDTSQHWVKIPSQELSDELTKRFAKYLKD